MYIPELAKELKKVFPFPNMELEIFMALKKLLPMLAVQLLILNKNKGFVLVEKTGRIKGLALPGGYVGLNEDLKKACKRIARDSLGAKISKIKIIDVYNLTEDIHGKGNGHVLSLIFSCHLHNGAKHIKYFKKIPKRTLNHHKFMIANIFKKTNFNINNEITNG
jgi:ADP-ribose pyrophosphatase YjhB (NUDIX family)